MTAAAHAQNGKSSHFSKIEKCTRRRLQLLKNGYEPLPAIGKAVHLKKWNSKPINQVEIESWSRKSSWTNTSLRCHNLVAFDIDVEDQWLTNSIIAIIRIELGSSPFERIGQAPRTLLAYRADGDDIRKHTLRFRRKKKVHTVEILARGQYFVAFGIHPGTRKKYKWAGPQNPLNTPIEELPSVTCQDIDNCLLVLSTFLEDQRCEVLHQQVSTIKRTNTTGHRIHPDFLRTALHHIAADDYHVWIDVGMAFHYETNGSSAGFEIWDNWSRRSGKYDESLERECEYKWHGFGRQSGGITGATVLKLAKDNGFNIAQYSGPREDLSAEIANLETTSLVNGHGNRPTPFDDQICSFPKKLPKPPGTVGLVAKYSNRASFRDQPLMDICAGLITVAALTKNWFVVGRWQTPLNMYVVVVAETGEGKEAPRKTIKAMINVVGGLSRVKESVSSSTALLRALSWADRHDITLLLDEFGRLLSVAQKPSNGHLYELISELMRLYGQADTTNCGKIYANKEDNIPRIKRPFVNMFGTTTMRSLTDALSSKDVVNGMLNRLLIVQTENRRPAYNDPNYSIDQDLEKALKNLDSVDLFDLENDDGGFEEDPVTIDVTPKAEELLLNYRDEADKCRIADGELGPLHARAFENAVKVAGVLAVGCAAENGPLIDNKPLVNSKCARWAINFVRQCIRKIVELGTEEIADSEIDRTINKIRNYVIGMTTNWEQTKASRDDDKKEMNLKGLVSRAQICRRFQKIPARFRDEAIQTLVESEDIQLDPFKNDSTEWFKPLRIE